MRKLSFNFLDWAKNHVTIPSKEEAKKILKNHSKDEVLKAYREVFDFFRTKKSFSLQGIKSKLLIVTALFVLLGNVAQAGLPTVESLEKKNEQFFNSLDSKEVMQTRDTSQDRRRFLDAMGEIKDVYEKLRDNTEFTEDVKILKSVIEKYSKILKNIDSIDAKDLVKSRIIAERVQADPYFGYMANINP